MATDQRLRREITRLGQIFGDVVREFEGNEAFALVEQVRRHARAIQDDVKGEHRELDKLLASLDFEQLEVVVRAFSSFLELANLLEDRQRVRALRTWEQEADPAPRKESIRAAIRRLADEGRSREQVMAVLDHIHAELVFTAHPTEAKRQSVRGRLRAVRRLLTRLDSTRLLPREQQELESNVRLEIAKLWQTDTVRSRRPTVLQEVQRGLSFQPVLWDTVPRILDDLRSAIAECFPGESVEIPQMLQFGSWMGGDRDGHPHVTPEITEQTCEWLRHAALSAHLSKCQALGDSISIADHDHPGAARLRELIAATCSRWPAATQQIESIAPAETSRRWLAIICWRIEQTLAGDHDGGYPKPEELLADVRALEAALLATENQLLAETEVRPWLDQIRVFGFRMARLDVRQHSELYQGVMDEIWQAARLVAPDETIDEARRMELLTRTLPIAPNIDPVGLSDDARKTLNTFAVLRRVARRYGMSSLGGHIVSMTRAASNLMTVLWLWKWSERVDGGDERDGDLLLPIIPLFETIDDLQHAAEILSSLLSTAEYRAHLSALHDEQTIMLGYSDSTKDGGYLSAAWSLQCSQIELHRLAKSFGVALTFFHGRGGSLGRGGGPAARAILSLPRETFHGSLRLTEQGEVLAERYDDPAIAHRHLEQVLWSILMATSHSDAPPRTEWREAMDAMGDTALAAYHELVEHPSFVNFFRTATPISEIEKLPIGSRPAKRKGGHRIQDLRAIPWVFSWTQSRCLLPAWYGFGTALAKFAADNPDATDRLPEMYQQWPFFRALVDNSVLALAKSNMPAFRRYVALADDTDGTRQIVDMLFAEFERASEFLNLTTGSAELLDNVAWLKQSIRVRNRYVDPLNLIQVELLRRAKSVDPEQAESLRRLAQLAIKGVAAGMRTTG